jgi:hypothetical protein
MTNLLNVPELGVANGGAFYLVTPANPVVGANLQYIVPDSFGFELRTVTFAFAASAAVATRLPLVAASTLNANMWNCISGLGVVALGTAVATFGLGYSGGTSSFGFITNALPRTILPPGAVLTVGVGNLQAGDLVFSVVLGGLVWPLR